MSVRFKITVLSEREKFSMRFCEKETDKAHFDWLFFTDKYCRLNQIRLYFIPNHM